MPESCIHIAVNSDVYAEQCDLPRQNNELGLRRRGGPASEGEARMAPDAARELGWIEPDIPNTSTLGPGPLEQWTRRGHLAVEYGCVRIWNYPRNLDVEEDAERAQESPEAYN